MQVINRIDEQGRYMGTNFYHNHKTEQVNSHTYSYLGARRLYQQHGQVMGLEKVVFNNEVDKHGDIKCEITAKCVANVIGGKAIQTKNGGWTIE